MTKQAKAIRVLEVIGARRLEDTKKFVVFADPRVGANPEWRVFLGKAGAVRVGRTVADSIPNDSLIAWATAKAADLTALRAELAASVDADVAAHKARMAGASSLSQVKRFAVQAERMWCGCKAEDAALAVGICAIHGGRPGRTWAEAAADQTASVAARAAADRWEFLGPVVMRCRVCGVTTTANAREAAAHECAAV